MATFANNIEVPTPLAPGAYDGTMQAATFEVAEPGEPENPSQLIDTDQAWGVKVDWEMHGILAKFLHATFELRILLEETLARYPEMTLDGEPVHAISPFANQLKTLPVRLGA